MDEPLASSAGNAIETGYAVDYLTGRRREPRFHAAVVALGAEMLVLGRLAADAAEGARRIEAALSGGAAAERFGRMVAELGGPTDFVERAAGHLPRAPVRLPVPAPGAGVVAAIDTRGIGLAVVALGGGRRRPDDIVDHAVGLADLAPLGRTVAAGEPLAEVYARDIAGAEEAAAAVLACYRIGVEPQRALPVVRRRLTIDTIEETEDSA
jgi:thymidine phosphorylase